MWNNKTYSNDTPSQNTAQNNAAARSNTAQTAEAKAAEPQAVAEQVILPGSTEMEVCPNENMNAAPIEPPASKPTPNPDPDENYCQVRFLHTVADGPDVNIMYGDSVLAKNLPYLGLSDYVSVPDGFRTFTVMRASRPFNVILRQTLVLRGNEKVTVCIITTKNGIALIQVPDTICKNKPEGLCCVRLAAMAYGLTPIDLLMSDGRTVFSDVMYKEVTAYRTAKPGTYPFIIADNNSSSSSSNSTPKSLLSFTAEMKENKFYTIYVVGIENSGTSPLDTVIVECD